MRWKETKIPPFEAGMQNSVSVSSPAITVPFITYTKRVQGIKRLLPAVEGGDDAMAQVSVAEMGSKVKRHVAAFVVRPEGSFCLVDDIDERFRDGRLAVRDGYVQRGVAGVAHSEGMQFFAFFVCSDHFLPIVSVNFPV